MDNNEIEQRIARVEEMLELINHRNMRVDSDKAWETSLVRRGTVSLLTYVTTAGVFWALSVPKPFANALIPVCGYVVSTLTVPWAKRMWLQARS